MKHTKPAADGQNPIWKSAVMTKPAALADALERLIRAGVPLDGASDHDVSEALALSRNNSVER